MRLPQTPVSKISWTNVAIGYGVWTLLAVFTLVESAAMMRARGEPVPWATMAPNAFLEWYSTALASLVLVWTVRRYPLGVTRRGLAALVYSAGILVAIALRLLIVVPLSALLHLNKMSMASTIAQQSLVGLLVFAVVVMVLNVIELQRRLKQRDQLALTLRAQLSEAELALLKGQLQPHFLFNTLNGIASLIHTAPQKADLVVVQLADLLRASIDYSGGAEIPLSAELALADKYIAIMEARFEGTLTIRRDIDPASAAAFVPQFILQPLVENAFEHGIAQRGGSGQITIRTARVSGQLKLEVSDDGAGLTAASDGVGLGNTRRRLERLYGSDQSLTLSAAPGGGAVATVTIPFRTS